LEVGGSSYGDDDATDNKVIEGKLEPQNRDVSRC